VSGTTAEQREAYTRWDRNRRILKAQGRWEPFVSAQPVRERIWAMNAAGMPTMALELRLRLPEGSLDALMWKRQGQFSQKVRRETAEAVMGYWPVLEDYPGHCLIDATGTRRRVQALITLGWTQVFLREKIGVSKKAFQRLLTNSRVTADLARRVVPLYDELWKRPPYVTEVSALAAGKVRRQAQQAGFFGPLAWDDDQIDDPAAIPQTDAPAPVASEGPNLASRWIHGEAVILGIEDRREVLQYLFEWTNYTPDEIAALLETTPDAASRQWERMKERARAEGCKVPWRRAYVPRERPLRQDEMEEVA
jgi:hypothetical protein